MRVTDLNPHSRTQPSPDLLPSAAIPRTMNSTEPLLTTHILSTRFAPTR